MMEILSPLLHVGVNNGSVSLGDIALPGVLLLTGVASLVVVGLAVVAFAQRRSRSYLLITMALATLLARTAVGVLAMIGMMALPMHHLIEHMLDGVMAVLLIAAVYYARTTELTDRSSPTASDFGRQHQSQRSDHPSDDIHAKNERLLDGSNTEERHEAGIGFREN